MDACCGGSDASAAPPGVDQALLDELKEIENDPTMASCCVRDLKAQIKSAELRTKLLSVDPSTTRQKLQQQVIMAAAIAQEEENDDEADDDGEHGGCCKRRCAGACQARLRARTRARCRHPHGTAWLAFCSDRNRLDHVVSLTLPKNATAGCLNVLPAVNAFALHTRAGGL